MLLHCNQGFHCLKGSLFWSFRSILSMYLICCVFSKVRAFIFWHSLRIIILTWVYRARTWWLQLEVVRIPAISWFWFINEQLFLQLCCVYIFHGGVSPQKLLIGCCKADKEGVYGGVSPLKHHWLVDNTRHSGCVTIGHFRLVDKPAKVVLYIEL